MSSIAGGWSVRRSSTKVEYLPPLPLTKKELDTSEYWKAVPRLPESESEQGLPTITQVITLCGVLSIELARCFCLESFSALRAVEAILQGAGGLR